MELPDSQLDDDVKAGIAFSRPDEDKSFDMFEDSEMESGKAPRQLPPLSFDPSADESRGEAASCSCLSNNIQGAMDQFMHQLEIHKSFLCLFCDRTFRKSRQLADHLQQIHSAENRNHQSVSGGNQPLLWKPAEWKSVFVCTECDAVLHVLDVESHSFDCNTSPLFPLPGQLCKDDADPREMLCEVLEREELNTQQVIFDLQSDLERTEKTKHLLQNKLLSIQSSITKKSSDKPALKSLIGKLVSTKQNLLQSALANNGISENQAQLSMIKFQLKLARDSFINLEKELRDASNFVAKHEEHLKFIADRKKALTSRLFQNKEKLAKIRMCRELRELEAEKAKFKTC